MRIGLTDYYTITKRIFVRDETGSHADIAKGYVLSVYGKKSEQIYDILNEMRRHHILGRHLYLIDHDVQLPHILVIDKRSVEKLEEQFRAQNITLDDNRFQKQTDWEDILNFEENRHLTKSQKLKDILANKAHYIASRAAYKKQKLIKKIRSALVK